VGVGVVRAVQGGWQGFGSAAEDGLLPGAFVTGIGADDVLPLPGGVAPEADALEAEADVVPVFAQAKDGGGTQPVSEARGVPEACHGCKLQDGGLPADSGAGGLPVVLLFDTLPKGKASHGVDPEVGLVCMA